jgi:hypothetical protein
MHLHVGDGAAIELDAGVLQQIAGAMFEAVQLHASPLAEGITVRSVVGG